MDKHIGSLSPQRTMANAIAIQRILLIGLEKIPVTCSLPEPNYSAMSKELVVDYLRLTCPH